MTLSADDGVVLDVAFWGNIFLRINLSRNACTPNRTGMSRKTAGSSRVQYRYAIQATPTPRIERGCPEGPGVQDQCDTITRCGPIIFEKGRFLSFESVVF